MVGECVERSRRSGVCRSFALVLHASLRVGLFCGRLDAVLNYNIVDGKSRWSRELDHGGVGGVQHCGGDGCSGCSGSRADQRVNNKDQNFGEVEGNRRA